MSNHHPMGKLVLPALIGLMLVSCEGESSATDDVAARPPISTVASAAHRKSPNIPKMVKLPTSIRTGSLEAFWTRFSAAALAGDAAAIRSLSAPVVLQRGILDDTPVVRLPVARVPAVVARVLQLPDGVDDAKRTQRELLESEPIPTRNPEESVDNYRFGDFVFKRGAQGWRLTELYHEE